MKSHFINDDFRVLESLDYVDEDVKIKYKDVKWDRFPPEVFVFDTATATTTIATAPFVFDQKIYVLGSTSFYAPGTGRDSNSIKNDIKKLFLIEFYDPELDEWTLLPSPLLRNDPPTEWVGHAVLGERRKVLFLDHRSHLYCFDLQKLVWINYSPSLSYSYSDAFYRGRTEFVDGTLYGLSRNHNFTIAAMKVPSEDEDVEKKASVQSLFNKKVGLGMVNFPPQVTSSRSFLHLGNGFFAYLLSGMPLPSSNNLDEHDDKERVLCILIILYSVHILGCFSVGPDVLPPWTKEDAYAAIIQSLHPNSLEAEGGNDVRV